MEPDTKRPRMSSALFWGWLLLTLDVPLFWFWSRGALERMWTNTGTDEAVEAYMMVIQAHWIAIILVWILVLVGMWATAKARDSSGLRQAAGLYLGRLVLDTAHYGALVAELVAYDNAWLEYLPLVSLILTMSAGAFFILHAQREGARGAALLIPILGHIGMLVALVFDTFEPELSRGIESDLFTYIYLVISLFYWLSWLAIPRETLSLDRAHSEEPCEPESPDSTRPPSRQDILVGALWAGGGLLVTLATFTGGGIEGRSVLAWGPIAYGLFRIFRGMARD